MKAYFVNKGDLTEYMAQNGVIFIAESVNERSFLLKAMAFCEPASKEEKSSTMELARALHETTKEPGMRRLIARLLGIRYMAAAPALSLIADYFDAVWEAGRYYQREEAVPENILDALQKNYLKLMNALTRGV